MRAGEQHVPGSLENEWDGSGFFEREPFRIWEAVYFGATDELRASTVDQITEICELRALVVAAGEAGGAFAAAHSGGEQDFLAWL